VGSGSVPDRAANQESETRSSIGETPMMDYFRFARHSGTIAKRRCRPLELSRQSGPNVGDERLAKERPHLCTNQIRRVDPSG
jgi:hypothetical protein